MGSNLPTKTRPTKKIRTTKEVFDAAKDKNRVVAMTFLKQVLTLSSRKKKRTSPILNAFSAEKKVTTLTNVP